MPMCYYPAKSVLQDLQENFCKILARKCPFSCKSCKILANLASLARFKSNLHKKTCKILARCAHFVQDLAGILARKMSVFLQVTCKILHNFFAGYISEQICSLQFLPNSIIYYRYWYESVSKYTLIGSSKPKIPSPWPAYFKSRLPLSHLPKYSQSSHWSKDAPVRQTLSNILLSIYAIPLQVIHPSWDSEHHSLL